MSNLYLDSFGMQEVTLSLMKTLKTFWCETYKKTNYIDQGKHPQTFSAISIPNDLDQFSTAK